VHEKADVIHRTLHLAAQQTGVRSAVRIASDYQSGPHEQGFAVRFISDTPRTGYVRPEANEGEWLAALARSGGPKRIEQPTTASGGRALAIVSPMMEKEKVIGAMVTTMDTEYTYQQAERLFSITCGIVALLAAMCTAVLLFRAHGLMGRPVDHLIEDNAAIRRGEPGAKFRVHESTELGILAGSLNDTVRWLARQCSDEQKLRSLFQQYVPASVAAQALGRDPSTLMDGSQHRVSVMVVHIRNFDLVLKGLSPKDAVERLNTYFARCHSVIAQHRGLVSGYRGATLVALFGMPTGNETDSVDAVNAALNLPNALKDLFVDLDEEYGWHLGLGIGISTGEAVVGQFGCSEYREFAALGPVVTQAFALERMSKETPEEDTVLISEATYRSVMNMVHVYDMGERQDDDAGPLHVMLVQGRRMDVTKLAA
jgi:class 3 adenylate cyclase